MKDFHTVTVEQAGIVHHRYETEADECNEQFNIAIIA
jgi:hypothetical protein